MSKKIVRRKKASPEPTKKKIVVKKKVARKKMTEARYITHEEAEASRPKTKVVNHKFLLRCYHGVPPEFFTKEQIKGWKTGGWFVIETKTDKPAKGTERTGYGTQDGARAALRSL